jgi:hypothetical protein
VRENAGNGPALDEASDIDEQEESTLLHANWAPVTGAEGYAVRIVHVNGATALPITDVGTKTAATLTDLVLQPDQRYLVEVSAYVAKGQDRAFSQPARSNGVQIVDTSPPVIESFAAQPAVLAADATGTLLVGVARDKTRLVHWDLTLRALGGETDLLHRSGPLATVRFAFALPWEATATLGDEYVARLRATDVAGRTAEAQVLIKVCPPGLVPGFDCSPPAPKEPGWQILYGRRLAPGCGAGRATGGVGLLVGCALAAALVWRRGRGTIRGG